MKRHETIQTNIKQQKRIQSNAKNQNKKTK